MFKHLIGFSFIMKAYTSSPFDEGNFESALDFIVNRAQEQVYSIKNMYNQKN